MAHEKRCISGHSWAATEQAAHEVLGTALQDRDADVRAYARRELTG
jgi:hypothetical protein